MKAQQKKLSGCASNSLAHEDLGHFEEIIWWAYDTGEKCAVLERLAMVEGRKVRIIHGLNISHKNSHTYCKNLLAIETKYYMHAPRGRVGRS